MSRPLRGVVRRPGQPPVRGATLLLGAALALAGTAAPLPAAPFEVSSDVEPRVAGLGEPIRFTIEVEGPGFQQPRLRPRFELDNLEIVAGPDSRHGLSIGGPGAAGGWHYSWTWWLAAKSVGPAAARDVFLLVGDREVELPARRVEVLRESPPGRRGARPSPGRSALEELVHRARERLRPSGREDEDDPGPAVLLQAVATPARPYVGERVLYTVYLLARQTVRAVELEGQPTYQGLWTRSVELEPAHIETVEWQGRLYRRSPLFAKELFALAPRPHELEPVRVRVVVDRIEGGHRLFSSPVRVPVEVVAESNAIELDVRDLPAAPASHPGAFSGVVGRLALRAELAPESVAVGQGATLTLTAAGDGHVEALAAPPVELPPGLDMIGPQPVAAPAEVDGARSWQYLLVPRRAGDFRLPAVELSYFDPDAEEYRVASAVPPGLVARPADEGDPTVTAPPRPIRSAALPAPPAPFWRSGLPWAFALPWVAAAVLILVRRRPPAAGARGGLGAFREQLHGALREERARRAAAAIERAWRGLLAEALGVPEQVPAPSWPDRLLERGVPVDACRELARLLEDLHYLRFAPELAAASALTRELVERSERLAREILRR